MDATEAFGDENEEPGADSGRTVVLLLPLGEVMGVVNATALLGVLGGGDVGADI